jgi:hypothetical protein
MQSASIGGKGAHSGARCSLQLDGHLNVRPRCCVEARQLPFEANPQFAFPDKCQMKPEGLEIECSLQARSTIPSKRRLDRSVRIPALNVIIQSLVRDWYSIYAPSFKHSARVLRPDLPRSSKGAVNCSLGRAPGNDDHNQHQSHLSLCRWIFIWTNAQSPPSSSTLHPCYRLGQPFEGSTSSDRLDQNLPPEDSTFPSSSLTCRGRRAYTLEIEPRFVDVAIRRWQAFSRRDAIHADSGLTFDELASKRFAAPASSLSRQR